MHALEASVHGRVVVDDGPAGGINEALRGLARDELCRGRGGGAEEQQGALHDVEERQEGGYVTVMAQ